LRRFGWLDLRLSGSGIRCLSCRGPRLSDGWLHPFGWRGLGRLSRRAGWDALLDHAQDFPNANVLPLGLVDAGQHPGLGGAHLQVHLFRFQLHHGLAGSHGVTWFLVPVADSGLDDRLTQFWNSYVDSHLR
jgi:hypothetical protein